MNITLTPSEVPAVDAAVGEDERRRAARIFAWVGPLRSASRTPTFQPSTARQHARFAVSADCHAALARHDRDHRRDRREPPPELALLGLDLARDVRAAVTRHVR
jgi:hypothetical protein